MKIFLFFFILSSSVLAMYQEEQALQQHYDKNPNYWSTVQSPKEISSILEQLEVYPVYGGRALDIGCGDGRLSLFLARYFDMTVDGIDMSPPRIEKGMVAVRHLNLTEKVSLRVADLYDFLDTTHHHYDLIAAFEVLEHLVDPVRVVKAARKKLTNNGWMIGSVPINFPYEAHLQVFPTTNDALTALSPNKWVPTKERGKDGKEPANIFVKWANPTKSLLNKVTHS